MGSQLIPSALYEIDDDENPKILMNNNFSHLNNNLLEFAGLLDVDVSGVNDGQIVWWNSGAGEWQAKTPSLPAHTTTTTVTTTTTTTTTTA